MRKERKVPARSCVACRVTGDKRGLLRIVRTPDGKVAIDPTGKAAGRGAYLCPSEECLRRALKEKRLSRALRVEVPEQVVREIEDAVRRGTDNM